MAVFAVQIFPFSDKEIMISIACEAVFAVALAVYIYLKRHEIKKVEFKSLFYIVPILFIGVLIYAFTVDYDYLVNGEVIECKTNGDYWINGRNLLLVEYTYKGEEYTKEVNIHGRDVVKIGGVYPLKITIDSPKEARPDFENLIRTEESQ